MKIQEVSDLCQIPITTLRYLEKVGILDTIERVQGIRQYKEVDIEQIRLVLTLKKMGLSIEKIKEYITLEKQGKDSLKKRILVLQNHRYKILDTIHQQQKHIDCLDYIVYQLQQEVDNIGM